MAMRSFSRLPSRQLSRTFSTSSTRYVNPGDKIPSVELLENSPGNKVDIAKELGDGRALIVGVPAAFNDTKIWLGPSCSETHIPGYVSSPKLKSAGKVFVVSVNDPFVMKAWAATLDPEAKSGIRFLADPSAAFAKALDVSFNAPAVFGGPRSKRYALVVQNGVVKEAHVEIDNTGMNVSVAEKVLK